MRDFEHRSGLYFGLIAILLMTLRLLWVQMHWYGLKFTINSIKLSSELINQSWLKALTNLLFDEILNL